MKKLPIIKNYIYCLSHPKTDELVYIGKTKNPKSRYKDHCRKEKNYYKTNLSKWKNNLFLENLKPVFTILDEFDSEIDYWEKYYIMLFKSWGIKLLNMTEGGDGLQNPSEETRKKIGEKSKGRKMSEKTKKAIYNSTYNSGKKIICYDKNKNFVGKYSNARRASEDLNISFKNISDILNNGMLFNKDYTFFHENEENIEQKLEYRIQNTTNIGKEFFRINILGEKKLYNNIVTAGEENNTNFKNIWSCLNKQRKTANAFAWVYTDEYKGDYKNYFIKKTKSIKIQAKKFDEILNFNSLSEACEYFKIKLTTIKKYINQKISKEGYIFEYVSEI